MNAGRKAFAAKGLGGASLREDILGPSGVSAGSFYHQFKDKAALLAEVIRVDGSRVIDALEASSDEPAADAVAEGRRLIERFFDRAEKNPHFVRIFVREYYSESPVVRREIRQHSERTIAALKVLYDRLASAAALPLDTESIATILSAQNLSVLNYYLGLSRARRAEMRPVLIRSMMQLAVGGVLAVRLPEDDDRSATNPSAAPS